MEVPRGAQKYELRDKDREGVQMPTRDDLQVAAVRQQHLLLQQDAPNQNQSAARPGDEPGECERSDWGWREGWLHAPQYRLCLDRLN